jgi:hypothetical protein
MRTNGLFFPNEGQAAEEATRIVNLIFKYYLTINNGIYPV